MALLFCLIFPLGCKAAEVNFTVTPILPKEQAADVKSYFKLSGIKPKDNVALSFEIANTSNEAIVVEVTPNNATTNKNGQIDYTQTLGEKDEAPPLAITDIVTKKQEVHLNPKEKKQVDFNLTAPETTINGMLLGGFYIREKDGNKVESTKGITIKNSFAYVVGLQVMGNNVDKLLPNLIVEKLGVNFVDGNENVVVKFHNTEAQIISKMSMEITIKKKNKEITKIKKEDMSVAPNSTFSLPLEIDMEKLTAGDYTADIQVNSKQKKWTFTKKFSISEKELGQIKDEEELKQASPQKTSMLVIISLITGVVGFVLLIVYLVVKKLQ
nr:DUF916 and DUF3324 domain-containing protein [Enterococcus sp. DIV0212c]